MPSTAMKLGLAGLGIFVVSKLLGKVADSAPAFAPRGMQGYEPPMVGYDPVAEAIGCAGSGSFQEQGLSGFGSKLKKAVKKAVKKPVALVQRDVKKVAAQVKRDVKNVTKPVVRDFKKAGALVKADLTRGAAAMKRDFQGAGALFKGGSKKKPSKQMQSTGGTIYLDENGNEITEAQYNALMAQYQAEYGQTPVADPNDPNAYQPFGADQFDAETPTYSMDEVAAGFFQQEQQEPGGDGFQELDVLAYAQPYADETGFADGTVPYTGQQMWDMPTGYDFDPLAAIYLPQDLQEQTWDAYAGQMTSGDNLIMPAGEPATPFSADELWIGYEDPDAWSRGAAWSPEPTGIGYGNPYYGGTRLPGYWEGYGGFDWNWENDGLGDLVLKPGAHRNASPAILSMIHSQERPNTYGYFIPQPGKKPPHSTPIIFKADKQGMVYARNGGGLHKVGPLTTLARALGLGCADFGRDMGVQGLGGFLDFLKKTEKTAKKVASYTTPSGFAASQFKKRDPHYYHQTTKVLKQVKPYALIAGGTALSVVSVGAASPAGAAMIAGGVASLGAQGYSDIAQHEAEKDLERAIERDREAEAIASTNVIQDTQYLDPQGGPAAGEIPGGDWPWEYPGDGVWADFLDLTNAFPG